MAVEMLVGLFVADDAAYQRYRAEMTPLLYEMGGGFGYDFRVSDVLKSETDAPINRVFTIFFADELSKDAFFSNAEYQAIKRRHFEGAVTHTTIISTYLR